MCYAPRLAIYTGVNEETGKRRIKFLPGRIDDKDYEYFKQRYGEDLLLLPCGSCPSCLKQYAFDWSVRLMAESLYHQKQCFLTLTYDQKHLPKIKTVISDNGEIRKFYPLVKKDLQDFLKRLRKAFPEAKIRYFACGEHGDHPDGSVGFEWLGRPHYHVILFGLDFDDKQVVSWNKLGQALYTSKTLEKIWSNGLVGIGEVSSESCGYVARYSLKKRINFEKTDEFVLMSRRPGIGYQFFQDHKDTIYLSDRIYNPKFVSCKVPRAFDKLAEQSDDVMVNYFYELSKASRLRKAKGKEYQNMIAFGKSHIEEAQVIMLMRSYGAMKTLRRSLC